MRRIAIFAALATLAAAPAAAQLGVGVGVGANVRVDPVRTVGTVVNTADRVATRAVEGTDRAVNRTIAGTRVSLAARTDVRSGAEVRDSRGQRVGTVQRLDGNAAVVVSGQNAYHVPLASLYRSTTGKVRTLYTAVPRAQLTGHANAHASAHSAAHSGH